jgi:hypothetical protein
MKPGFANDIRTSVHADLTGSYKSYCLTDLAWIYITLSHSAARLQHLEGSDTFESIFYHSQSVSAVNSALSLGVVSDITIATVSCLANLEVCLLFRVDSHIVNACCQSLDGRTSSAIVHISGLQRMVQLKGGLGRLGLDGVLQRMVLWYGCSSSPLISDNSVGQIFLPVSDWQKNHSFHCRTLPRSLHL